MKRECKMLNHREDHCEGKSYSAIIVEKRVMACTSVHTQGGILEMAREEALEDK